MATRRTPAARALVACLAFREPERSHLSTSAAYRLAGYELKAATPVFFTQRGACEGAVTSRVITRNGRIVTVTRNAYQASLWLHRLGSKLVAAAKRRERLATRRARASARRAA